MTTAFKLFLAALFLGTGLLMADGFIRPPIAYQGSLEERAQEAIIVFREGEKGKSAVEDLIIKIRVEGEARNFAWIVPLPNAPRTSKEDPRLFQELHRYVQLRKRPTVKARPSKYDSNSGALGNATPKAAVEVISREVVGAFDVAVVRENRAGVLNEWLAKEGYQQIKGGEKLLEEYRRKGYVFACTKVSNVTLAKGAKEADLHPLRFTFETGGRDGIYFPMRITGLQSKRFDINLYIFYRAWLNDKLNKFGYTHQGFDLNFRDWDSRACKPNAGKLWSKPALDPYLKGLKHTIPTVSTFFAKHHRGKRFYLTNIQAHNLKPRKVLGARNELWLFPYYTAGGFVPFDKRDGGPAVD